MLSRTEARLKAAQKELEQHGLDAKAVIDKAEDEDRDRTDEENAAIAEHQKAMEVCKKNIEELEAEVRVEQDIDDVGRRIGQESKAEPPQNPAQPKRVKSIGEQFTDAEGYKRVKAGGFSGKWNTGEIKLEGKATLVEGDNWDLVGGTPGEGAALIPMDQRPGVLPILYQRLTIEDLLASGTTSSNAVRYAVESVNTSGAGVVAEGDEKPESTLEFDQVDEAVKKIATAITVTDEMLEDAQQIQSFLNSRLALFVRNETEAQLLGGAGGANFLGLLPRIPVANRFVVSTADTPNTADHIYEAITTARRSFLEPDGIVIHPDDWADLRLLKDDNLNYIGGSPFSNTGQGNPAESLWGKPVVVTTSCIPGTAVVGAFGTAAQVFNRGGLSVEATNSHAENFLSNLTVIRAERRLCLAVYRPEAFAIADLGGAS